MKPRVGVMIGAGFFAEFQAESWQRMEGVKIAAVADVDRRRAQEFAERHGIEGVYEDAEAMIAAERPSFVDIVTRPESHLALAEMAASQGCDVICQKPMAPAWNECVAMVRRCEQTRVRLLIHENWRFQPWYREIKRILDGGILGRLYYAGVLMRNGDGFGPEPYPPQPYFRVMPRLLLYETGIHFLDTLRYLVGEITEVHCRVDRLNPVIAGEDAVLVSMRFAGGAMGLFDANRMSGPNPPAAAFGSVRLEGERAMLRMEPDGQLFVKEHGGVEMRHQYEFPKGGYRGDSVHAAQLHYLDSLNEGTPAESEGREYLKSVRAMFACYESAAIGLPVDLTKGGLDD